MKLNEVNFLLHSFEIIFQLWSENSAKLDTLNLQKGCILESIILVNLQILLFKLFLFKANLDL